MEENKYILSKNAIGIILIWLGPPLFYFFRSQFHLGGGSITSGIFYLLSLFLLRNPLSVQIGYKPNILLLLTGGSFYLLAIIYFLFHNFNTFSILTDSINIFVTIAYFFLIIRVSNQVQKFLPFWLILITLIINVTLLYSIITNPNYVIGLRATVQLGNEEYSGNPGIYAKNGLLGALISILFLNKKEESLYKQNSLTFQYITVINFVLSLITILITQTRMILLSFILISIIYLVFVRQNSIKNHFLKFNKKIILLYSFLVFTILEFKFNVISILKYYVDVYWMIFERAILTSVTFGKNKSTEVDISAMGRVDNFNYFLKLISQEKFNLLFGKGFNYRYMDIPIIEVIVNFGIFTFLFYLLFLVFTVIFTFKSLKSKSIFQNFLALANIQLFIALISSGRPMDLFYTIIYVILIRFLNVESSEYNKIKT